MRSLVLFSLVLCIAAAIAPRAAAQDAAAVVAAPTDVAAPAPLKRWLVHVNFGVTLASWKGAMADGAGGNAAAWRDMTNRQTISQFVGVGYFFTPELRLNASVLLSETVGGLRAATASTPGESPFTSGSLVVWGAYYPVPWLFFGLGPIFAARAYDAWQFDFGLLACIGAAASLGSGFSLGAALQSPFMFGIRPAWSLALAIVLAYRF